ncbi:iron-containing alcohol dehydrogenase [Thermodesulfobacteriota bacterium]
MSDNTFICSTLEKVVFGVDCSEAIRDEADNVDAQKVFLLTVPELSQDTDVISRVKKTLGNKFAGLYDSMKAHAPTEYVIEAAEIARDVKADLLVTIGGSSVVDTGKVMLICLKHRLTKPEQLEPYHFYVDDTGKRVIPDFEGPDVRLVAVPTTLSGGEFTPVAGAKNTLKNIKEGYEHRQLSPRTVILDPAITIHTPDWLWFSTGVKSLDHAIETLGSLLSNDFCDGIADSALKLLSEGLIRVKANPTDMDGRLKCMLGTWQSMIPVLAGVPMGASHAIGHILGGVCDVPHGYTSCVLLPSVMQYNESINRERQRRIASDLNEPGKVASDIVDQLIRDLGMPRSLSEISVTSDKFEEIASISMHDDWIYTNPRPISGPKDVVEILKMAE